MRLEKAQKMWYALRETEDEAEKLSRHNREKSRSGKKKLPKTENFVMSEVQFTCSGERIAKFKNHPVKVRS